MTKSNKKELRFRVWVDVNGERFFGPGRAELLQLILDTGSISKAAKEMGMSYKKAWAMIDTMNKQASKPYVVTEKGGQKGGGTLVTKEGKAMLKAYNDTASKIEAIMKNKIDILDLV